MKKESSILQFDTQALEIGQVLVALDGDQLVWVDIADSEVDLLTRLQKRHPQTHFKRHSSRDSKQIFAALKERIETPHQVLCAMPALSPQGTAFQQAVWQALLEIPLGLTVTYTDLAQRIGRSTAVRAVANACGQNPLPIFIPCHRVLRRSGDLGGYSLGIHRKVLLLSREIQK